MKETGRPQNHSHATTTLPFSKDHKRKNGTPESNASLVEVSK